MRVKKLNANRRPKAGDDDDDDSSSSSSPSAPPATAKWISPAKHGDHHPQLHHHHRGADSEIGSSSPTDPSGVHPLELADVRLATPRLLFSDAIAMANSQHPPHLHKQQQQQQQSVRDGATTAGANARKPLVAAAAKKTTANTGATWREQVPSSVREGIHAKIVDYLKALKPNAPEAVLARLPGLASRMEKVLLQLASSQEEFVDAKSLASRLVAIQQSSAKKLLQQQTAPLPSLHGASASSASTTASFSPADAALRSRTPLSEDQARFVFQCLQSWRQKLVNIYGVAPWEILPNSILAKVAVYAPSTEQELSICGVRDELIARFGSSLLKELQLICGSTTSARSTSPSPSATRNGGGAVKASRKADSSKRPQEPKKRKTSVLAPAGNTSSSTRLTPTNSFLMPTVSAVAGSNNSNNNTTMLPLFRAAAGVDSLPALLPSATAMKPAQLFAAPPRLPSPRAPAAAAPPAAQVEELHHSMHLLAQGAGHVSKQQQDAKALESYEKELQATRWQLQQAQQENERLREQVQQLLHQQQQCQHHP